MKIRFNMEIKGCWWRNHGNIFVCPHHDLNHDWCNKADRKIRKRNPSWCPMMKGGK
jgi:hypothetical protein